MAYREPLDQDILREAEAIHRFNVLKHETNDTLAAMGVKIGVANKKHVRQQARGIRNLQQVWTRTTARRTAEDRLGW